MNEQDEENTVVLDGGGVEYALEDAAVDIDELIDALESAKGEGATHVVMSSGNYRGAKWAKIRARYDWVADF